MADLRLFATIVCPIEKIAAVVTGNWYGSEDSVFYVLFVSVEAVTLLVEIFSRDDLLVHEKSQLICLLLLKLSHDVKGCHCKITCLLVDCKFKLFFNCYLISELFGFYSTKLFVQFPIRTIFSYRSGIS